MGAVAKKPRSKPKVKAPDQPLAKDRGMLLEFYELYPATRVIENSYVLSRFWAWFSQIQWSPKLRIPLPRAFTRRDP